jgi:hypothetical protein
MLRIIGGLFFILLVGIITFSIHPILGFLVVVLPIVGVIYNWKDL